jgi:hypothetical protein
MIQVIDLTHSAKEKAIAQKYIKDNFNYDIDEVSSDGM